MSCYKIPIGRFISFFPTAEENCRSCSCSCSIGLILCTLKWHHNNNTLKTVGFMEGQATLLGKTNSGIQIAKLIQWLWLNFPLQNNQIGCRRNLLPESQFYCRYFSPKVSFISPMQILPPSSAKEASSRAHGLCKDIISKSLMKCK